MEIKVLESGIRIDKYLSLKTEYSRNKIQNQRRYCRIFDSSNFKL